MTDLKHAFHVDVSPIVKACVLLVREAWSADEPESRDSWMQIALEAKCHADSMANELSRLRELEVKWHRALAERRLVGDLMLAANGAANFLDGVRYGECYSRPLRGTVAVMQDLGPIERPVSEADLELFRKLVSK